MFTMMKFPFRVHKAKLTFSSSSLHFLATFFPEKASFSSFPPPISVDFGWELITSSCSGSRSPAGLISCAYDRKTRSQDSSPLRSFQIAFKATEAHPPPPATPPLNSKSFAITQSVETALMAVGMMVMKYASLARFRATSEKQR